MQLPAMRGNLQREISALKKICCLNLIIWHQIPSVKSCKRVNCFASGLVTPSGKMQPREKLGWQILPTSMRISPFGPPELKIPNGKHAWLKCIGHTRFLATYCITMRPKNGSPLVTEIQAKNRSICYIRPWKKQPLFKPGTT